MNYLHRMEMLDWIFAIGSCLIGFAIGVALLTGILQFKHQRKDHPDAIPFDAICPGCGHRGCKLRFIPPPVVMTDEVKGTISRKVEDAKIERTCDHCGATCYQNVILPAKEWIA